MINLETQYMGLTLRNPIIVGSSGLTNSVEKIKELETNGAGAVVLKSIFEEQIQMEVNSLTTEHLGHAEEMDYITQYTKQHTLDEYLKLIKESKQAVSIPVIASINCISSTEWVTFARRIQDAGADALELNVFIMPANFQQKGEEIEQRYFDIIAQVREQIDIPIAVKMSYYFSGLSNMVFNISVRDVQGIVLFNRFYSPDIDLDTMEMVSSHVFSTADEYCRPLRWIGLLADHVKCDLAASTGIHDGFCAVKNILVGAKAVQVASVIYKKGPAHIKVMLDQIETWMKDHNYTSLKDFQGKMSQDHIKNPVLYERAQFMKYFAGAQV